MQRCSTFCVQCLNGKEWWCPVNALQNTISQLVFPTSIVTQHVYYICCCHLLLHLPLVYTLVVRCSYPAGCGKAGRTAELVPQIWGALRPELRLCVLSGFPLSWNSYNGGFCCQRGRRGDSNASPCPNVVAWWPSSQKGIPVVPLVPLVPLSGTAGK